MPIHYEMGVFLRAGVAEHLKCVVVPRARLPAICRSAAGHAAVRADPDVSRIGYREACKNWLHVFVVQTSAPMATICAVPQPGLHTLAKLAVLTPQTCLDNWVKPSSP